MADLPPESMSLVYLPGSWVLSVEADESCMCFVLDAVLQPGHPLHYSPSKPDEQHPHARLRWCLRGEVWWNEGPNLDRPPGDAAGERHYGNVDAWLQGDDVEHLEGEWGMVAVRGATHTVTLLP